MKKIINNRVYDTTTAIEIGRHRDGWDDREVTLYRKRTGEFFAYDSGGLAARYSDRITPYPIEAAKSFVEAHCDADVFLSLWGAPEDGDKITMSVTVSPVSRGKLEATRDSTGKSISAIVNALVLEHL